ncbi:MAG: hypothetical protein ABFS34_11420 [Gemmatimonadota bacterium]
MSEGKPASGRLRVERVQSGVRMEKRLIKILKALADLNDMSLGDLLEGIVLHAFDGKAPFGAKSLEQIQVLKQLHGFELDSSSSHRMLDKEETRR